MKQGRILGLCLIAVLAFAAVAAAGASAAPVWRINGAEIKEKPVAVNSKGTLELTDTKGGIFGEAVTVKGCSGIDKGTVGVGGADEITSITGSKGEEIVACKEGTSGCESPRARAINLPWKTELFLEGTEVRDRITTAKAGWEVKCKTAIGEISDVCEGATSTGIKNVTGSVEALFDAISEKTPAKCSRGGAGTGLVKGTDLIENPPAGTLTAS